MVVVILSVTVATVVGPAILTLLGPNVDRWRIGTAARRAALAADAMVNAALKRPAPVAAVLIGGRAAGPGGAGDRAEDRAAEPRTAGQGRARPRGRRTDRPRRSAPGWDAPFQVVAVTDDGPDHRRQEPRARSNTSSARSRSCPGVKVVIGPGAGGEAGRTAAGTRQRGARLRRQHRPGQAARPARPRTRRRRRRGRRSCAKGSPKRATAPGCWRSAPTAPARGRS